LNDSINSINMKSRHLLLATLTCLALCTGQVTATDTEKLARAEQWAEGHSTHFLENKGQVKQTDGQPAPYVAYHLERGSTQIYLLREGGIAYQFNRMHYPEGYAELMADRHAGPENMERLDRLREEVRLETYRMDMRLIGADPQATITTEGRSEDYINYYNHDALDVRHYRKVTYHDVYPGIDWVIYTTDKGMKYDFVVRPGADPAQIRMRFTDHEELFIDEQGNLIHGNRMGRLTEDAPVSFQGDGKVGTRFVLEGDMLSFELEGYDADMTLLIDPFRIWGTYYGGGNTDRGTSCATDANGNVYLAGYTSSTNAIASAGHQNAHNNPEQGSPDYDVNEEYINFDAFLVKFNSNGMRQWATYYGGENWDVGTSCVTDSGGNIYLAGSTCSPSQIAHSGHQNSHNNSDEPGSDISIHRDAFLVKFNASGTRQWATYYGGEGSDSGGACATDPSGNVYLAGSTNSSSAIASNGHQNMLWGGSDAFLVKFNGSGVRQWATYYGGEGADWGVACATDPSGNVYLAGGTNSSSAIAFNGHQNVFGGAYDDAFLVKFNESGVRQWATYYGGSNRDWGTSCATDVNGNVFLSGTTLSLSSIAFNGHQNTIGWPPQGLLLPPMDAFLVKFSSNGVRQWATYYGGESFDQGNSCTTDGNGNVYLVGGTNSSADIAFNGHQNTWSGGDAAFIAKFSYSGTRQWATYYGGSGGGTEGYHCAADESGNVYLAGQTSSPSGIAYYGHQNVNGAAFGADAFLVQFSDCPNCGGTLYITGDTLINYFDTLDVQVRIEGADNLFAIFAKLRFDNTYLQLISSSMGGFLGTNVINQPPIVTGNTIDFGMTKIAGQSGSSGNGLVYSFRFKLTDLPNIPFNASSPSTFPVEFSLTDEVVNDATGALRNMSLEHTEDNPFRTDLRYYVPVWPGDLNNDYAVNVADILPIGYFYNATGPTRPNAGLQWVAQPAPLWGFDKTNPNSPAYRTFADGNGNGIIDLADQNSIGFNLGSTHNKTEEAYDNPNRGVRAANAVPYIVDMVPTQLDSTQLPTTLPVTINLGDAQNPVSGIYGIAFDLLFNPSAVDVDNITLDYAGSIFGTLNSDFIKIEDSQVAQGRISIGMTRYNTSELFNNGRVLTLNLPLLSTAPSGWFKVEAVPLAANDSEGFPIATGYGADSLLIITQYEPSSISEAGATVHPVSVYPNPTNGSFTIDWGAVREQVSVALYNGLGQLVKTYEANHSERSVMEITGASGVYHAVVRSNDGRLNATVRVVKE
jgi:hypothetical protein